MELAWIENLLALAECGGFTRAAEWRHVTQPAFSRRIRMPERWVGADLVDRSSHRVRLTAAGLAFRPAAEELRRRLREGGNAEMASFDVPSAFERSAVLVGRCPARREWIGRLPRRSP